MYKQDKDSIIAASSIWVSVLLNILPGVGSGYLYQRRWKAYWLTGFLASVILSLGQLNLFIKDPADPLPSNNMIGIYGVIILSIFTSIEAGLAVITKRAQVKSN